MTNKENANLHVQSIWLHLLKSGGWHKASEIRKAIECGSNVDRRLRDMADSNQIVLKLIDGISHFGVTSACRIPRALTLATVMEAAGAGW